ncbi:glycosyltransferase family 43 [Ancylostoma ceylanicum]|uniref:Galactosylgalactosylxylosylprotein 3-beta-glucuronosyltransferase n=1 Tax=Ancylostoma ceylanicum TaxID=53326 RepID=A0A0D6LW50_9BILA|nr:glycosyltransferase family 43 [Ancylostoma ceylanicum]
MSSLPRSIRRMSLPVILCITMIVAFLTIMASSNGRRIKFYVERNLPPLEPLIIVITPTYKRPTRLADMTRLSNTLRLVPHVHWIVIEDGFDTVPFVENLLRRSTHNYTYMAVKTPQGYPKRGWYQRTSALWLLRNDTDSILGDHKEGVVFFGDDDNSYDTRLFTDYIRHVKKLGMWAVGLAGGSPVESPDVVNGSVVGYRVKWGPRRKFAVDMAGFAINLDVVLNTTAVFGKTCKQGFGAPEPCLLEDMGFTQEDIEPFGFDQEENREVLVWHTKTVKPWFYDGIRLNFSDYAVEL